jgi:ribosomal protein S6
VTDGSRYFWEARFVCSTFDASPAALKETERLLRNEESVLKFFTVKLKTAVDRSKATSYKNPYLK